MCLPPSPPLPLLPLLLLLLLLLQGSGDVRIRVDPGVCGSTVSGSGRVFKDIGSGEQQLSKP
jgi:hypothetical protein